MFDISYIENLHAAANFPVEISDSDNCPFPEITLVITMDRVADEGLASGSAAILGGYFEKYNMLHFLKPMRSVSDADEAVALSGISDRFDVVLRVDFGQAHPLALVGAVRELAVSGLPIKKLTVH